MKLKKNWSIFSWVIWLYSGVFPYLIRIQCFVAKNNRFIFKLIIIFHYFFDDFDKNCRKLKLSFRFLSHLIRISFNGDSHKTWRGNSLIIWKSFSYIRLNFKSDHWKIFRLWRLSNSKMLSVINSNIDHVAQSDPHNSNLDLYKDIFFSFRFISNHKLAKQIDSI